MASLKYSLFALMPFMLHFWSLLLLLLASCFSENIQALDKSQFHTLEINTLLPSSKCRHQLSTDTNTKQLHSTTLKVSHKHGPCSSTTQNKPTNIPSVADILSQDQLRVDYIQARAKYIYWENENPKDNKFKDAKVYLPAQSGLKYFNNQQYIVTMNFGTPIQKVSFEFDTGSDLTWTQCLPCVDCYKQLDAIFNPYKSNSYSTIPCKSQQCSDVYDATFFNPSCYNATCVYYSEYNDQSFSNGFLSKDKLTLTPTDVFPDFIFGCGHNNTAKFGYISGLLGLGRSSLSFVSQTSTKYNSIFSYCLPSTPSSMGYLSFGKMGTSSSCSNNVKFTPFNALLGTSLYFIDLISISVGGHQLSINQSVFEDSVTVIDSATVITRLPMNAYAPLRNTFNLTMMKKKHRPAPPYSILDTCYYIKNYKSIDVPTVSFTFKGNVTVDLGPSGILYVVNSSLACLGFAGNSDPSDISIFGNTQQKTLEVVYDIARGKLGFRSGGCH